MTGKKPPVQPQRQPQNQPGFEHKRESVPQVPNHKTSEHNKRSSDTTVFRTRPIPDPGKK